VRELGERNAKKDGKSRWGFKIMREIKNLEKYAETFPDATYIHIIRDGRDVAASQISEHGSWGYGDISRAAAGWCSVIDGARATSGSVRYTEVRYEDIVMKPEETIRRLLDFLGVDWDPAVLAHSEQGHSLYETKVRHPSRDQVARPINDSALGRYRRDLKPEQIEAFEKVAGASLVSLGYMNTDAKNERK
ncbi:MAG: sulfotransferase, partial [Gammaproteobacteria bacterium]|nr:sulfotransferase [Gammaproteobacteria bacterium]